MLAGFFGTLPSTIAWNYTLLEIAELYKDWAATQPSAFDEIG